MTKTSCFSDKGKIQNHLMLQDALFLSQIEKKGCVSHVSGVRKFGGRFQCPECNILNFIAP